MKSHLLFLSSIADKWTMYINYAVVISHSSLFIPSSSYLCYTLLYSFDIIQYHLSNGRDCWPRPGEMVSQCAFAKCCKRHLGKLQDDGQYSFAIGLRVIYCTNLQTVYFPRGLPLAWGYYTVQTYILCTSRWILRIVYCTSLHSEYFPRGLPLAWGYYTVHSVYFPPELPHKQASFLQ